MKGRNREEWGEGSTKQSFKATADLELSQEPLYLFQSHLLKWAQDRRGLVQLDCPKLCTKAADF